MAGYRALLTEADAARSSLIDLWTRNLRIVSALDEKFRWFYLDAPSGPANAFLLEAQDGADAGRAVGCAGVGQRELCYRGQRLRAALLADLAVDRSHRTVLPAITLQRSVRRHTQTAFDLSYGFPNEHAVGIHVRIGFHLLGHMERWVLVLRHEPYLRRVLDGRVIPAVAGKLVDASCRLARAPRIVRAALRRRLDLLDDVDERFDRLWERSQARYPITARRTSAFLRWRFLRKPSERNRIAAITDRLGGELRAYAVIGERSETAHLLDLFGESDEDVDRLLDLLTRRLRREGFAAISVRFLGLPALAGQLAARGFRLRERVNAVVVDPGAGLPIDPAVVRDPQNWYLTDGDEDT